MSLDPRTVPVRFTNLKSMAQSPAHYRWVLEHNERKQCYDVGTSVHSLVLGGDQVTCYTERRSGKAWEAFQELHAGETILNVKEYDGARRMADAVLHDPVARPYLAGRKEVQVDWKNGARACSSRLDIWGDGFICDLKTGKTAHPDRFQKQATWMGYHAQLSWYLAAARWQWGADIENGGWSEPAPQDAYIIAVEKSPPYLVTVHKLSERAIEQGDKLCHAWLERLLVCESGDDWPGYTQRVLDYDVPDEEQELDFGGSDDSDS